MEYKLGKVSTFYDSLHKTPKNYNIYGYPMVRVKDISTGFLDLSSCFNVSEDDYLEFSKKYKPQSGDIIITRVGTYGNIALVTNDKRFCLGQNTVILNIDKKIIDNKYLFYYLTSSMGQQQIESKVTGSTQKTISLKSLKEINIIRHNFYKEKQIGDLLYKIDNKINNNKQIIANLEEFSQTIFKRWFVDFEFPDENGNPYKLSGGEMVDSELGEIPSGWKIIELKEVTEIIMGQSPKSDTYNTQNEGLPLLNGATDFKNRNIKPTKYTTDPKKIGQFGDFVFGVRATVGLVTELDRDYAIGRGAGIARINSTHKEWLYEILVKAFQYFENSISGSVYINVSSNDLKKSKVIYPSKKILDAYHKNLVNNFELVKSMKMQIKHLTQLRDTLLPKLMAGEIEIPDDIEVNEDEFSI
ncbi:restriction endonuclease subunit S [Staphylococcus equorum]|uniref:restriction endonuclease subunit S n=1 Tax=Staphylococcus equorum TaxID=246432 RepID=UPI003F576D9C